MPYSCEWFNKKKVGNDKRQGVLIPAVVVCKPSLVYLHATL